MVLGAILQRQARALGACGITGGAFGTRKPRYVVLGELCGSHSSCTVHRVQFGPSVS